MERMIWISLFALVSLVRGQSVGEGGICTLLDAELSCEKGMVCVGDTVDSNLGICRQMDLTDDAGSSVGNGSISPSTFVDEVGEGELCTLASSEVVCLEGLRCTPNETDSDIGTCEKAFDNEEDSAGSGQDWIGLGGLCTLNTTELQCTGSLVCSTVQEATGVGICSDVDSPSDASEKPSDQASGVGEMCTLQTEEFKCAFGLQCMKTTLSDVIGICESDEEDIQTEGGEGSICTLLTDELSCKPPLVCTDHLKLEGSNQGQNSAFGTCSQAQEGNQAQAPAASPTTVKEGGACLVSSSDVTCEQGLDCVPLAGSSTFGRCERANAPAAEQRIDFYFTGEEPLFEGTTPKYTMQTLLNLCGSSENCQFSFKASKSTDEVLEMVSEELEGSMSTHHVFLMGQHDNPVGSILAKKYPDTLFTEINLASSEKAPNLESIVFREDEAGFLAGSYGCFLVSHSNSSPSVGILGYMDDIQVKKYTSGFHSGCLYSCSTCEILTYDTSLVVGSRSSGFGKFLDKGIDILFDGGSNTEGEGFDYLVKAAQSGVIVIGAGEDVYLTTFGNGNIRGAANLATSAQLDVAGPVADSVRRARDNGFESGYKTVGLSEGAVSLANCHQGCSREGAAEAFNVATAAADALKTGAVQTNVDLATGELQVQVPPESPVTQPTPPMDSPSPTPQPPEQVVLPPDDDTNDPLEDSESDDEDDDSDSGLSGADIFGIVLACLIGAALLGLAAYTFWGRFGKKNSTVKASSFIEMEQSPQGSFINEGPLQLTHEGTLMSYSSRK